MRNFNVDLLRFAGLAMIILAHAGPPPLLFQFRNFDVPLMVMVAGISFHLSYRGEAYGTYLWKRINRLVFPVWIFLSIYFVLLYGCGFPTVFPGWGKVITSYLLLSGIGYVWIIRVFLLVALVSPLLSKISAQTASDARYFVMLGGAYMFYELLADLIAPISASFVGNVLDSTLLYLLPYSLVFAIGLRLPSLSNRQVGWLCLSAAAVFVLLCGERHFESGVFVPTQVDKYPPTAYYLSFALAGATFLWWISDRVLAAIKSKTALGLIKFIAQNSIWIYLWHIPMVDSIHQNFVVKYLLVFLAAVTMTFVQVRCVERLLLPRILNAATKKRLKSLLTG